MEIQSYNQELEIANLQFKRIFNNISIVSNGKEIKFRCMLGHRSRIFKHLENPTKDSQYTLPIISIERTGITKNNDRLSNINNEVKYMSHSSRRTYDLYTPVPIDINYKVDIISKYQNHIDRCISNFIPFFNKDLYVRSEHPKFEGIEYTSQVVMDDSIEMDKPDELEGTTDDLVVCTCNFTYKTYLFCGSKKSKENDIVYIVKTQISCDEETGTSSIISVITDTEYIGFVPTINQINVGYYPIPLLSTYSGQFKFVDDLSAESLSALQKLRDTWVDCFVWNINESGNIIQENGRYLGPGESNHISVGEY